MSNFLHVENLSKSYGDKPLFENISFDILKGEKVALIAKNGSGKTSLINIISGRDIADDGKFLLNKDISVGFLDQEPDFDNNNTVIEQVFTSSDKLISAVKDYEKAMVSGDSKEIENAVIQMDVLEAWDYESTIKQILDKLKIFDFNQSVRELSGGQKKRLALANTLINNPDFLILDEPTNHLDFEMIEYLETYLTKSRITLFIVTHDRYFLDKVCDRILEIDGSDVFSYKGNYAHYLEKRAERIENLYAGIEKAKNMLRKEAEWMNRMPQARSTKSKYRIDNFYKIKDKASLKVDNKKVDIDIEIKRLGNKVVDVFNISKKYGDNILINDFSYKFDKLEKIGIIGNNGTGKSTLLNILTQELSADSGYLEVGATVHIGYYRQSGLKFNDNQKVIEVIKEIAEVIEVGKNRTLSAAQFLEYFLFPRDMHYNEVARLSGGEKRRLYLMTILMRNPNFLILDEPTNDLDIMTLNVLEDYLSSFGGTLLIVSHDRYFTDKVADTLFVFEESGEISHFPGNYSQYLEYKKENDRVNSKQVSEAKPVKEKTKQNYENRLSYKEKVEFEAIEKEISDLNKEKQKLDEVLSIGNLTADEFTEKSKRYSEIIDIIDEKEFRWLELSEKE